MTTSEIKKRYAEMKPTQDRLQILADLNGCEKKTIQAVLDGHEPDKPKPIEEGRKKYIRWTAEEEVQLIEMVKAGKRPQEAAEVFGRPMQGVVQKAQTLGRPFPAKKRKEKNCSGGVCEVPKVGEVVPAVGTFLINKPESAKPDYAETVRTITDQLNQIIEYADKLRQENDRLTRQLARVREAVE
jgi:hypothetical protein